MGVSGVWQVPSAVRDRLLAAVAWIQGAAKVGAATDGRVPDLILRTFGASVDAVPRFAELVIPMEPVLQRFLGADGCEPPVQTFRYRGTDGILRRMLWCADCGHTMICEMSELQRMVRVQCRKCDAPARLEICEGWHAFGRCGACPPVVA